MLLKISKNDIWNSIAYEDFSGNIHNNPSRKNSAQFAFYSLLFQNKKPVL